MHEFHQKNKKIPRADRIKKRGDLLFPLLKPSKRDAAGTGCAGASLRAAGDGRHVAEVRSQRGEAVGKLAGSAQPDGFERRLFSPRSARRDCASGLHARRHGRWAWWARTFGKCLRSSVVLRHSLIVNRSRHRFRNLCLESITKWEQFDLAACAAGAAHPPHSACPPSITHARRDPLSSFVTSAHAEHTRARMTSPSYITTLTPMTAAYNLNPQDQINRLPSRQEAWLEALSTSSSSCILYTPLSSSSLTAIRLASAWTI